MSGHTPPRLMRNRIPAAITRHAILLLTGAIVMLPFVWMVSLSMKPPGEISGVGFSLLPQHWYMVENYTRVIKEVAFARYILNGVFVCSVILGLQILICAPCAYALAKLEFRGRSLLFNLVLVGLLIPDQVLALPRFIIGYQSGILDTYVALIFPYMVSPLAIFLFRQFFKTIPNDVVHAARLDGLSELTIVWKIMVPMSMPAVIAFAIFSVVSHWNDLFWPLIAIHSEQLMPPPLGIMAFKNEDTGNDYGALMAAATLVVSPLVIAFLAAQRGFVEGLTGGAVK